MDLRQPERWMSTSTARGISSYPDLEAAWRQTTNRLLNIPIGELNSPLRSEVRNAIIWWSNDSGHGDGITISFKLMDRLCQEEAHLINTNGNHHKAGSHSGPFLFRHSSRDLLNLLVNNWRKTVTSMASSQSSNSSFSLDLQLWHPSKLVEKVKHYHQLNLQYLKPDYIYLVSF